MMTIINYLLLISLLTALLVAVYVALSGWLHTPATRKSNEYASPAKRTRRPGLPHLLAGPRRRTGITGRPSQSHLITAARLSSFARTSLLSGRKS